MPAPSTQLRLFVAIYPPLETSRRLIEVARSLSLPPCRWTPAHQVHLTLQFIGERAPRELDDVRESVERSAAGLPAFELAPSGLILLPERGPARLIGCETSAPASLLEAQRRLAHRLAREPRERSGERFRPHLTLARFQSPARLKLDAPPPDAPSFMVGAISLMRSILKTSGAEHVELARVPLS